MRGMRVRKVEEGEELNSDVGSREERRGRGRDERA